MANGTPLARIAVVPIQSATSEQKINIFSNPANEEVTIALSQRFDKTAVLMVINSLGKTVAQLTLEKGSLSKKINIKGFSAGMYIIQLKTARGVIKKEMMIVH